MLKGLLWRVGTISKCRGRIRPIPPDVEGGATDVDETKGRDRRMSTKRKRRVMRIWHVMLSRWCGKVGQGSEGSQRLPTVKGRYWGPSLQDIWPDLSTDNLAECGETDFHCITLAKLGGAWHLYNIGRIGCTGAVWTMEVTGSPVSETIFFSGNSGGPTPLSRLDLDDRFATNY
jgi:hypothetical protein